VQRDDIFIAYTRDKLKNVVSKTIHFFFFTMHATDKEHVVDTFFFRDMCGRDLFILEP
jgi:hypothetical protein